MHPDRSQKPHRSRQRYALALLAVIAPVLAAIFMPGNRLSALAGGVTITGIIMLAFAGLGFLGMPMKADADPRDVGIAAAGLIVSGMIVYLAWYSLH